MEKILEVKDLVISFKTDRGIVHAVRGVSFDLFKGETLCIVGESGSGKSVTNKAIMGINAKNAIIENGSIYYEGEDLVHVSEDEFHRIRGHKIGMIFQDPLSALNPVMKVGNQIIEATLINKNILKRRYHDLIASELTAYRNELAKKESNIFKIKNEINNNNLVIKNINSTMKSLSNLKKNEDKNSERIKEENEKLKKIKEEYDEYVLLSKRRNKENIEAINYEINKYNSLKNEDSLKQRINEKHINQDELLLNILNDSSFLPFNDDILASLKDRNDALLNLIEAYKQGYSLIKDDLKEDLKRSKEIAKKDNKEYYAKLKEKRDTTLKELNEELSKIKQEIIGFLPKLSSEDRAIYEENKKKEKKSIKKLFSKDKSQELTGIAKATIKKEEVKEVSDKEFLNLLKKEKELTNRIEITKEEFINATKITKAEAKKMAINVMKEVGIPLPEKRFKQYPFEFSGGMRQRIVIAIALTANPEILICDEPTTALDVTIQAQILELINNLKKERNLSCIFITHDLGVVAHMADRVAVMYAGKIVEYGTSNDIFFDPKHPYTWALLSSIPDLNSKEKLEAIPGTPPDMIYPPKGDAFALRNKYALDIDFLYEPPFFKVSDTHYAATWLLHKDAPHVEMPKIVKTRIENVLKIIEEDKHKKEEDIILPNEENIHLEGENSELFLKEEHEITTEKELKEEVKHTKFEKKVKFKQEYVDNKVILSVNHLKQFFFLGKGFNKFKLKAVRDVNFQVHEKEVFGIVGESGCGKTTTGRSIIKLYDITSGSIYYKGYRISAGKRWNEKEIKYSKIHLKEKLKALQDKLKKGEITSEEFESIKAKESERTNQIIKVQKEKIKQIKYDNTHTDPNLMREIQVIFQDPIDSLDPRMTVESIISEGLIIQGEKNKAENHKKVVEMLEKVGLIADYANRYPHEFSGGQRQRIGIARALIMNPKLLICDEPISALDVSIRAQIINLLSELKEEMGLSIIFIAHDLSVVKYFCDRIAVMYFGEMVELAASDELFKHPLHPYTKSLLSAIPIPNPYLENKRVRISYDPIKFHDYSKEKPKLVEICQGHFILANSEEVRKYKKEIEEIDKKNSNE